MMRIRREAEVLTNLDHPYIVNLQEVFETTKYVCIVMEYAAGGDLFHYIVKQPNHRLEVSPSSSPSPAGAHATPVPRSAPPHAADDGGSGLLPCALRCAPRSQAGEVRALLPRRTSADGLPFAASSWTRTRT